MYVQKVSRSILHRPDWAKRIRNNNGGLVDTLFLSYASFQIFNHQQRHIINTSKKPITCVCWSDDGCYLVTGEAGHLPCVRVWDINTMSCIGEFSSHKFGINCVAFSPSMKYIVSVGFNNSLCTMQILL